MFVQILWTKQVDPTRPWKSKKQWGASGAKLTQDPMKIPISIVPESNNCTVG